MTFKLLIENNLNDKKYKESSDQLNDAIKNNPDFVSSFQGPI